ncbi:MAG TPA: VWA domain-containing protein [Pyrinomonadaceae bacterium]|jgi:VWFA-related protein
MKALRIAVVALLLTAFSANAQQRQQQSTPQQTDDVLRIKTELVQTDVMVFDQKGRFVEGLRPEQFELEVNGQKREISFFERVTAGSSMEAAQLSAARRRSGDYIVNLNPDANDEATERGRLIFFFLDDLHLSGASLIRARAALQRFVDNSMNPNDQVAIVSTSGQVGLLQQLTDNQIVLHAAIKRLGYKQNPEAYTGKTQISEYMASQVLEHGNRELYAYLLESIKLEQQMGPGNRHGDHQLAASYSAAPYLRNRLRQTTAQGRMATADTLSALRGLMLSSAALPGRKLVFFLSDGFILNERKAGALEMLHSVTEAAARSGAVVYTVDLRGTFFGMGSGVDASTNDYIDLSARRAGVAFGEISATRESLQLIADETGGRAIFNSSSIDDALLQAIRETSNYYLLAWRPDAAEQHDTKARLKVSLRERPDLRVRLRSNSFSLPVVETKQPGKEKKADDAAKTEAGSGSKERKTTTTTKEEKPAAQANDTELLAALSALYPQRGLPVALSVGYLNASEQGPVLKLSMQLERAAFGFDSPAGAQKILLDVAGAALDDRGQFASFKQLLTITPDSSNEASTSQHVVWHQQLRLKPGLYQVRVALRERESGRVGSAMQWIEIPDLSKGNFSLSSLFLGERGGAQLQDAKDDAGPRAIMVDVDHRFQRSSVLRFQTYVYNAARGAGLPDVRIQAQVFRNKRQVMATSLDRVPVTGDTARLPFWSEIALQSLPPGRYVLQVTATDRVANRTATERVNFNVE